MTKVKVEMLEIGQKVKIRGYGDREHTVTGKKRELGMWLVQLDGDVWYEIRYIGQ